MNKILLSFIFLLILIPIVSSVAPITTQKNVNIDNGIDIEFTKINVYKSNRDIFFSVSTFNRSDGLVLTNTTTECNFHLFNFSGTQIIDEKSMNYDLTGRDWDTNVLAGNFTENGAYSFLVTCNASNIGGFVSSGFDITADGFEYTQPRAFTYISLLVLLIVIFIVNVFSIIILPSGNIKNEVGDLISINHLKYLTYILYPLAWFLMIAIMFTSANIGIATNINLFGDLFFAFYTIMLKITPVMVVVWFGWILLIAFRDGELKKILNRGFPIGNKAI